MSLAFVKDAGIPLSRPTKSDITLRRTPSPAWNATEKLAPPDITGSGTFKLANPVRVEADKFACEDNENPTVDKPRSTAPGSKLSVILSSKKLPVRVPPEIPCGY